MAALQEMFCDNPRCTSDPLNGRDGKLTVTIETYAWCQRCGRCWFSDTPGRWVRRVGVFNPQTGRFERRKGVKF